jgi:hypothetical protein
MKFRKKPVVIEATQWYLNGDHPGDHAPRGDGDHLRYADYVFDIEGKVVRHYNTPNMDGKTACKHCGNNMCQHGWIDTLEGGHIVCPGDWVITGVQGERYPCKPDIFAATYEAVSEAPQAPQTGYVMVPGTYVGNV